MPLTEKAQRAISGWSKLNNVLENVRQGPKPLLANVKSLHLKYGGYGFVHEGASKFARNELVRLAYHNPSLSATRDLISPRKYSKLQIKNNQGAFLKVLFSESIIFWLLALLLTQLTGNQQEIELPIAGYPSPTILSELLAVAGRGSRRRAPTPDESARITKEWVKRWSGLVFKKQPLPATAPGYAAITASTSPASASVASTPKAATTVKSAPAPTATPRVKSARAKTDTAATKTLSTRKAAPAKATPS
ncbi:hypothetical protein BKA62DRAFT_73413 [Auriculariales sp. MPI-PUGE-AT-0066]|nr:hypothetical protein BKA62DRAFT_73413 [Auriculariales sp. MPI-PUGE-AT-0066]